jgi:hypothetical protein
MAMGLPGPVVVLPGRRPGSVRRTITFDTSHPAGMGGPILLDGRGRDLWTTPPGTTRVLAEWRLVAELQPRSLRVRWLTADPAWAFVEGLVGESASAGLRSRLREQPPGSSPLEELMVAMADDLPGAALIGGFAAARSGELVPQTREQFEQRLDVCAGWARGATMDVTFLARGTLPMPVGVPLPPGPREDPLDWHRRDPLPPASMRRQRLIDLAPVGGGDRVAVAAHFRDLYISPVDEPLVLHEYTAEAELEGDPAMVSRLEAAARVLPWPECPSALSSVAQAVGRPLGELRQKMGGAFMGTTCCTHLTDTVRSLGHVEGVARRLALDGLGADG